MKKVRYVVLFELSQLNVNKNEAKCSLQIAPYLCQFCTFILTANLCS